MRYLLAIVVMVFASAEARTQVGVPEEVPDALHVLSGKVFLERSGMLSDRLVYASYAPFSGLPRWSPPA